MPTRQADPSTHAAGGRLGLPVLLAALFLVAGCAGDSTTTPPAGDGPAPDNPAPDFSVVDVNETSPRFDEMVSPRDYLGEVSAWYFGHATWYYCRSQFGFLDMIQTQLHAEGLAVPVRILGVNPFDHARSNPAMCAGRDLPWLQETETDDVWSAWSVTYRDVIVLDADNVPVDVYNVTDYDLSVEANREELKQKLRAAATGNGR